MILPYSIVIAEDETLLLKYIKNELEHLPLPLRVVGTAQTGRQAYELIERFSPDILITDIRMPLMSGIELLEKTHENFPYIKTVIISGYADFQYAQKAITLHVADYLLKPVNADKLKICINGVIRSIESNTNDLLRKNPQKDAVMTGRKSAEKLREYFITHLNEKINYNALARSMNYSPNHLAKVFEQCFTISPMKYLSNLRIEKAKKLLCTSPTLTIREISVLIGYEDQNYFSKAFKKSTQYSPLEYRQKCKEEWHEP